MTILSETTRHGFTSLGNLIFVIGLFCLIIAIVSYKEDANFVGLIFAIACVILVVASYVFHRESYQQIKAVISDNYSAKELYDNYDVVGHDGKIWILNERN